MKTRVISITDPLKQEKEIMEAAIDTQWQVVVFPTETVAWVRITIPGGAEYSKQKADWRQSDYTYSRLPNGVGWQRISEQAYPG